MRPTDRVAWSVCRYVTVVSPAKMAEPIEMPFGLWVVDSGGPKEACVTWGALTQPGECD